MTPGGRNPPHPAVQILGLSWPYLVMGEVRMQGSPGAAQLAAGPHDAELPSVSGRVSRFPHEALCVVYSPDQPGRPPCSLRSRHDASSYLEAVWVFARAHHSSSRYLIIYFQVGQLVLIALALVFPQVGAFFFLLQS